MLPTWSYATWKTGAHQQALSPCKGREWSSLATADLCELESTNMKFSYPTVASQDLYTKQCLAVPQRVTGRPNHAPVAVPSGLTSNCSEPSLRSSQEY